jgi:hypothetical protein
VHPALFAKCAGDRQKTFSPDNGKTKILTASAVDVPLGSTI